ncbi:MAG: hypothetical protein ACOZQL_00825 [Myxococcota bacterium]
MVPEAVTPPAVSRAEPSEPLEYEVPSGISTVKVFSATFAETRNALGERVTDWLAAHPELSVVDRVITQTADAGFHCLTITLFLSGDPRRMLGG